MWSPVFVTSALLFCSLFNLTTMAELSDVNVLCKFDEGSAILSSGGFTDDFVIFTSSQRISVYRVCVNSVVKLVF